MRCDQAAASGRGGAHLDAHHAQIRRQRAHIDRLCHEPLRLGLRNAERLVRRAHCLARVRVAAPVVQLDLCELQPAAEVSRVAVRVRERRFRCLCGAPTTQVVAHELVGERLAGALGARHAEEPVGARALEAARWDALAVKVLARCGLARRHLARPQAIAREGALRDGGIGLGEEAVRSALAVVAVPRVRRPLKALLLQLQKDLRDRGCRLQPRQQCYQGHCRCQRASRGQALRSARTWHLASRSSHAEISFCTSWNRLHCGQPLASRQARSWVHWQRVHFNQSHMNSKPTGTGVP